MFQYVGRIHCQNVAVAASHPFEVLVVVNDWDVVKRDLGVEFDEFRTRVDGGLIGDDRVFRITSRRAPMSDHRRDGLFGLCCRWRVSDMLNMLTYDRVVCERQEAKTACRRSLLLAARPRLLRIRHLNGSLFAGYHQNVFWRNEGSAHAKHFTDFDLSNAWPTPCSQVGTSLCLRISP